MTHLTTEKIYIMKKIKVGVIGGAGYTGGELLRIIINHPNVDIIFVHSKSNAGNLISDIHRVFNGEIWESITKIEFLESFEGKGNKINPKIQAEFCFILGQIEGKRNNILCPNMEKWVEATFNIKENSYSKGKIHKPNKEVILNKLKLNGII